MKISASHAGGNIIVRGIDGDHVRLATDLRDTMQDWFYWNFCVEGAQGRTLTFDFAPKSWIGYHGAAVSCDNESWSWTNTANADRTAFTYTFGPDEDKVYFCHDMYYPVARFEKFAARAGLDLFPWCRTLGGREVPYAVVGEGDRWIMLTSRHHCCESTGTYVMEGMIEQYLKNPIEGYKLMCVPFVDLDGVVQGDQGKYRAPHDHQEDYCDVSEGGDIYPQTRRLKQFIEENDVDFCFDLHAPWHIGKRNDYIFHVSSRMEDNEIMPVFSRCIQDAAAKNPESMKVDGTGDIGYGREWNVDVPAGCLRHSKYTADHPRILFSEVIETTYFGTFDNVVTQKKLVAFGRSVLEGVRQFMKEDCVCRK